MDAISFVLGVKTGQLRGNNLKELITVGATEDNCFVRLVYTEQEFTVESPKTIEFMRAIASNGTSKYKINNKSVTAEVYDDKLRELGILVKARNFLVFQVGFLVEMLTTFREMWSL
jgi:structural maintenance of chromosome 1